MGTRPRAHAKDVQVNASQATLVPAHAKAVTLLLAHQLAQMETQQPAHAQAGIYVPMLVQLETSMHACARREIRLHAHKPVTMGTQLRAHVQPRMTMHVQLPVGVLVRQLRLSCQDVPEVVLRQTGGLAVVDAHCKPPAAKTTALSNA